MRIRRKRRRARKINSYFLSLGGKRCGASGTRSRCRKQKEAIKSTMEWIDDANAMIRQLKKQLRKERRETKLIVVSLRGRNKLKFRKHKMVLRKMIYEYGNVVKCSMVENTKLEREQKIAIEQMRELTKACETLVFDECRMHIKCEGLEKQIRSGRHHHCRILRQSLRSYRRRPTIFYVHSEDHCNEPETEKSRSGLRKRSLERGLYRLTINKYELKYFFVLVTQYV